MDPQWRVTFVKYVLRHLGYTVGRIDDNFGIGLRRAVQAFQADYYLRPISDVDDATWVQMRHLFGNVGRDDRAPASDRVRAVQDGLNRGHGYSLDVDGIFGPLTEGAVRDFQRAQDIAVDGIVGLQTFTYLVIAYR
nr:peptidoglycan-binding protein [Nocardiopsis mwathae]